MTEIVTADDPSLARKTISIWLSEATLESGYQYAPSDITLAVVDEGGQMIGGLTGTINWKWLYIETLAVDPGQRGHGHARDLVSKAEDMAREQGCHGCWVDTFTFQVPEFYKRLGYESFGELPGYPDEQSRVFLRKIL